MIITMMIPGLLLFTPFVGKMTLSIQSNKQIAQPFALSPHPTKKYFRGAAIYDHVKYTK